MSSTDLVSLCVLRLEVDQDSNNTNGHEGAAASEVDLSRGQRVPREINIETYPSRLESPRDDWGLLPAHKRELPNPPEPLPAEEPNSESEIGFFSGNPFVELTKGILHLYKEDVMSSRQEAKTLCLLGVPATMTCHDLLSFTAPCHADIAHIRVLRDQTPNQYMALLTFRQHQAAVEFYDTYNGAPFNSLEPEPLCRAVWISSIEWSPHDSPPAQHTELPTCPVCLERMDESVAGVLTILCNHAFHAQCLGQWADATCPVCRCVQSPECGEGGEGGECMRCGAAGKELWICLICGNVGCGRYQEGHAAGHWRESGHCYALQLGSHRVWDYKGDNFVHRLLQNKADGKLVAAGGVAEPAGGPGELGPGAAEKVDSVQLEFTYLLASQLDAQRQYFEERVARAEREGRELADRETERVAALARQVQKLEQQLSASDKERQSLERKLHTATTRLAASHSSLQEERELCRCLRENQTEWQRRAARDERELQAARAELAELRDQLRDLMFYVEAGRAVERAGGLADELRDGTVSVAEKPEPKRRARRRKR